MTDNQTLHTIIVICVIIFIIISLYKEYIGPAFTFMIGVLTLGIFGILKPHEILAGFANEQIAVVIMLLLIGDVIRRAAIIEVLFDRFFQSAKSTNGFIARMMILISGLSAFLNNTPLVAVMIPYINSWCSKTNVKPSKLLIPLSYAAILGGCATLIGTSTNLIVNGFVIEANIPNISHLNIFDFTIVGLPMIFIGYLYIRFIGYKLLPNKADVLEEYSSKDREYVVEVQVKSGSKIAGKSVKEAGLRSLPGLYLIEIVKSNYTVSIVSPNEIIEDEDILIFAGATETIADMVNNNSDLILRQVGMYSKKSLTQVMEIVISHNSTMIGRTVKELNFRSKFDAATIAIHRNGERVNGKIGSVTLKAGDVLLLIAGADFPKLSSETLDFYLISKVKEIRKIETYKIITLLGGTGLAILISALTNISLFLPLAVLLTIILLLKIASPKELPKSIDYNLAIIIVLSLALGKAMDEQHTGLASEIANRFISIFEPLGIIGILTGIYIITAVLAAYVTNKAAVAIIFPIAISLASVMKSDPMPFILVTAFASAANFMTPIGYQTNLMVYGPGGYNFKDYFKVGFPLTIIYMIVCITVLSLQFNLL